MLTQNDLDLKPFGRPDAYYSEKADRKLKRERREKAKEVQRKKKQARKERAK